MQAACAPPAMHKWHAVAGPVGVALGWMACAYLSILWTRDAGGIAAVWPANALLLGALLTRPRDSWASYALASATGAMLLYLQLGISGAEALVFPAANTLEVIVAATLIVRYAAPETLLDTGSGVTTLMVSCAVGSILSASLAVPVVALVGDGNFVAAWLSWFTADYLGLLIVTPLLLASRRLATSNPEGNSARCPRVETVAILALVAVVTVLVFGQSRFPLLFLPMVPVMIATHRLRAFGAVMSSVIIAVIGSWYTLYGRGPVSMVDGSIIERIYYFQFYLAVLILSNLPKAALLSERDARARQIHATAEAAAASATQQASTDELTGLPNRRALMQRVAETCAISERHGLPFALALFDVDHFKRINDSYGHVAGDHVLRCLAQAASALVREGDMVARVGGEEFALLMPMTDAAGASWLGERLRATVAALRPELPDGTPIELTVSIGVAQFRSGLAVDALIAEADGALYAAKREGRNLLRLAA